VDESDSNDGAEAECEGSGPGENPKEYRARARFAFSAFADICSRKKKSEDAFHDTENMDVQRTMDESHTSWRRISQILNMRYYHAVL
jgi:hypothetical protein